MSTHRHLPTMIAAFITLFGCVATAHAQPSTKAGLRIGFYTDAGKPFVGGELLTRLAPFTYFNPNLEYVFTDAGAFMTFNADFHYDLPSRNHHFVWIGGGIGGIYVNPEGPADGNTDLAVNLLTGVGLSRGPVIPFLQGKVILSDDTEFVIAFGMRF